MTYSKLWQRQTELRRLAKSQQKTRVTRVMHGKKARFMFNGKVIGEGVLESFIEEIVEIT